MYLRHRTGDDRRTPPANYEPLTFGDPLIGAHCAECQHPLKAGQRPSLFVVGPDSLQSAREADLGHMYQALAVVMHETCAWAEVSV